MLYLVGQGIEVVLELIDFFEKKLFFVKEISSISSKPFQIVDDI